MLQRFLLIPLAVFLTLIVMLPDSEPLPIKVGILHSLTGTMAVSEIPVMQATLLAVEQINAQGGLLGRKVEAIVVDGKSDWPTFAREAERLIVEEKVSVVFGCWTSACRKTVKPIFEKHKHLLFYPVQYEGLEQSPNIISMGAAPNQQIIPALSWSIETFGPRIYLIGSDYVFPHVANLLINKLAPILEGSVIGEHYLPLGSTDFAKTIKEIKQLKPDVIINTINGDSNFAFFRALSVAGITVDDTPVLSFSIGETELANMQKQHNTIGHYAAWNYFQSINSPENDYFINTYQLRFGKDLPVSDPMEAAWIGVQLWASAVKTAQTDNTGIVLRASLNQSILAPEGIISIDNHTQHAWKTIRIGKIQADGQFEIVWSSTEPIRPAPYPLLFSKFEAENFLDQLYKEWDENWAYQTNQEEENKTQLGESQ